MNDKEEKINYINSLYNNKNFFEAIREGFENLKDDDNWKIRNIIAASLLETNQNKESIENYKEAIKLFPNIPELYNNIGAVYKKINQNELALENYKKAIKLKNDYRDAHLNIANIYQEDNEVNRSIKIYKELLKDKSDDHIVLFNLGNAYLKINNDDGAFEAFEKSNNISNTSQALNNIGLILIKKNNYKYALEAFKKAIITDKEFLDSYLNIQKLLLDQNKLNEALSFSKMVINKFQNNYLTQFWYAQCLEKNNLLIESIKYYKRTIELNPKYKEAYNNLSLLYAKTRKTDEALKTYKKIEDLELYSKEIAYNHATLLTKLGHKEKAKKIAEIFIKKEPKFSKFYNIIALVTDNKDKELQNLIKAYEAMNDQSEDKILLGFNIAKILEKDENYKLSSEYITKSNKDKFKKITYDANQHLNQFQEIRKFFTKGFVKNNIDSGFKNNKCIFVIGMPRSGSSLIEQILASHSDVKGLGELKEMTLAINENNKKYSKYEEIKQEDFKNIGENYIKTIQNNYNPKKMFVDKALMFQSIGFIKLALPESKIILCSRNPNDQMLSIFKNYFLEQSHPYSYDEKTLKAYFQGYKLLSDHWLEIFEDRILEIRYEELINGTRENIKKILKYCNLEWQEGCLDFHQNKRYVDTISASSVKKPIYKTAINISNHYKDIFKDLLT